MADKLRSPSSRYDNDDNRSMTIEHPCLWDALAVSAAETTARQLLARTANGL